MENESWISIAGYEGLYSISTYGRVMSHRNGRCLKPIITKFGYARVHLAHGGITKTMAVHRLVALAFVPNPDSKPRGSCQYSRRVRFQRSPDRFGGSVLRTACRDFVLSNFEAYAKEIGAGVMYISHDQGVIDRCDMTIELKNKLKKNEETEAA